MGLFWLGGSAGYFIKLVNNKARRQHYFHSIFYLGPWEFPIYMLVGGIASVYLDWYRRVILESACEYEEKMEPTVKAIDLMKQNQLLRKHSITYEGNH